MEIKSFIFGVWLQSGKTLKETVSNLETVAERGSATLTEQNGRIVTGAGLNGKSFSYTFPDGFDMVKAQELCHQAWLTCQLFDDDQQLELWLKTKDKRVKLANFGAKLQ